MALHINPPIYLQTGNLQVNYSSYKLSNYMI
jgi:hypothetical protein